MSWSARCAVAALLIVLSVHCSTGDLPRIVDNPNRNYTLYNEDGTVCLYASFDMNFMVIYKNDSETDIHNTNYHLPPSNEMTITGECNNSLDLRWTQPYGIQLGLTVNFTRNPNKWTISRIAFSFVTDNSSSTQPMVYETYKNSTNLLNRTYNLNQYFYCERCKTFYLVVSDDKDNSQSEPCQVNTSRCSNIEMMKAVIYPGDITKQGMNKLICIEDYIALQEIIVPTVVGGILTFLLVIIFVSYVIAYFRRRRKESRQYEPVTGDI